MTRKLVSLRKLSRLNRIPVIAVTVFILLSGSSLFSIQKSVVARDDHIYEAFPDIAMTSDGTLVCIYRECMGHGPYPFSRIAVRRSFDGGKSWSDRQILIECVTTVEELEKNRAWLAQDAIAGYQESLSRIKESWQIGSSINCPRILYLRDGTLLLVADFIRSAKGTMDKVVNKMWRSTDAGATWSGPKDILLRNPDGSEYPGIVPALTQLRDGRVLLALSEEDQSKGPAISFSSDHGNTWGPLVFLPSKPGFELAEVNYVELDDRTLVGFGRNVAAERERRPSGGLKVISHDGGKTWRGPFETWLMGLEGRPKPGLLKSRELCITYRLDMPNEMLAMHVMTQEAAKLERPSELIPRKPVTEDIPARLARERGQERPWYMTSYYPGRTFVLDVDRSVHRDAGYSGWVEMPSGDIFVVDYINDDAPLAQIRGYLVRRSDYLLFPEGDLPWLHPSGQPFREITASMAKQQYQKNRNEPAR